MTFQDRSGSMFDETTPSQAMAQAMAVPTGIGGDSGDGSDDDGSTTSTPSPTGGVSPDMLKALHDATAKSAALGDETDSLMAARKKAIDPRVAALSKQIDQPGPPMPQLEKAPKAPTQELGKGMMEYMQIATVFGALAGLIGRRGTTTSLNAFAGAIKGFTEGNLEMFKQKSEEWKQANQEVQENNQQKIDQYKLIWNDKKMNIDQKMEEMKLVASQYGDEITYNLANQRNYTMLAQSYEKQIDFQMQFGQKSELIKKQIEMYDARIKDLAGSHEDGIQSLVERRLTGDKTAAAGMGRSRAAMGQFNDALKKEMVKRGMTAADLTKLDQQYVGDTARARLGGTMQERVEAAVNEVEQAIPIALQDSQNLPRGKWVPINKLMQMGQQAMSNPQWNSFLVSNQTLAKAYGRAMNPQGIPRVSEAAEAKAHGFLDMAASPEAYKAQVIRLWQEAQNSKKAILQSRDGLEGEKPFPGGDAGGGSGWSIVK